MKPAAYLGACNLPGDWERGLFLAVPEDWKEEMRTLRERAEAKATARKPSQAEQSQVNLPVPEYVFIPDGDGYFIQGFGESGRFTAKGAKGFHDIYRLIQSPVGPVPMLELDAGPGTTRLQGDSYSKQPVADGQTREDIAATRRGLKADIEAADTELERSELQAELDKLESRAKTMYGLNGNPRELNNANDGLRAKIHARIQRACAVLKPKYPKLAEHFTNGISADGACMVYTSAGIVSHWQTQPNQ